MDCSCQAPLFMGFSRQEYRSGLSFPPPGYLPDLGIEPASLTFPALAGTIFTTEPPVGFSSLIKCLRDTQVERSSTQLQVVKLSQDEKKGGACRVEC